jgi:hypothetical protein
MQSLELHRAAVRATCLPPRLRQLLSLWLVRAFDYHHLNVNYRHLIVDYGHLVVDYRHLIASCTSRCYEWRPTAHGLPGHVALSPNGGHRRPALHARCWVRVPWESAGRFEGGGGSCVRRRRMSHQVRSPCERNDGCKEVVAI